jgi:hypothetical protein
MGLPRAMVFCASSAAGRCDAQAAEPSGCGMGRRECVKEITVAAGRWVRAKGGPPGPPVAIHASLDRCRYLKSTTLRTSLRPATSSLAK